MKSSFFIKTSIPILMIIIGCTGSVKEEPTVKTLKVKTDTIKKVQVSRTIHCSGMLSSKTEAKLSFKTGGIINKILVDESDYVRKDQVLAQLNLSEIKARVEQARSGLSKSERDLKRIKSLYNDSVSTLEQFQNAKTAVEIARANLQIAEFNLKYSTITAPSNGKILKRLAEPNEIIGAGRPVFLFASVDKKWILRTGLTDKDIINIEPGDTAIIKFDAYPGKKFPARVSEIGNIADPYTGTYEVELRLEDPAVKLASGFIGKADIFSSVKEELLEIPINALAEGNESVGYVYKVKDELAVKTKIIISRITDGYIYARSGLTENDIVVTIGKEYIKPGIVLETVE